MGAVPRSLRYLGLEDKDGYQLHRAVVMSHNFEQYMNDCRKNGIVAKPFVYDYEKYNRDLKLKTELEAKLSAYNVCFCSCKRYIIDPTGIKKLLRFRRAVRCPLSS